MARGWRRFFWGGRAQGPTTNKAYYCHNEVNHGGGKTRWWMMIIHMPYELEIIGRPPQLWQPPYPWVLTFHLWVIVLSCCRFLPLDWSIRYHSHTVIASLSIIPPFHHDREEKSIYSRMKWPDQKANNMSTIFFWGAIFFNYLGKQGHQTRTHQKEEKKESLRFIHNKIGNIGTPGGGVRQYY